MFSLSVRFAYSVFNERHCFSLREKPMLRVSLRETLGKGFLSRPSVIRGFSLDSTLPYFAVLASAETAGVGFRVSENNTVVGSSGLEPPTSRLSGERSNQLSYEPMPPVLRPFPHLLVEMKGIEPLTPCLQGRCSPI